MIEHNSINKSQIESHSGITNHLTKRFKSLCQITDQITWNVIKSKSLEPKSQIKSNHDFNQMTTAQDYSLFAKCHQCTSGLTVNVSAKIRDGTITEINSWTQPHKIKFLFNIFQLPRPDNLVHRCKKTAKGRQSRCRRRQWGGNCERVIFIHGVTLTDNKGVGGSVVSLPSADPESPVRKRF